MFFTPARAFFSSRPARPSDTTHDPATGIASYLTPLKKLRTLIKDAENDQNPPKLIKLKDLGDK